MSSQSRPSRHQRRASQSVFVLPEDFAATVAGDQAGVEGAAAAAAGDKKKPGFHRPTKSMSIIEEIPEPRKVDAFATNIAA